MANVLVGRTAAELTAALLSLEGAKLASLSLTNTQIKAAPTTLNFEIVASAGGKINVPIIAVLVADFSAGAYTNLSTNLSSWAVKTNNGSGEGTAYLKDVSADTITEFTTFMGAVDSVVLLPSYAKVSANLLINI